MTARFFTVPFSDFSDLVATWFIILEDQIFFGFIKKREMILTT